MGYKRVKQLNGKLILPDGEGDIVVNTFIVEYDSPVRVRQVIELLVDDNMPGFNLDAYREKEGNNASL